MFDQSCKIFEKLVDERRVKRDKVIEYKRCLGRYGGLSQDEIEKDVKASLESSPQYWGYGGLLESDFLNLVFEVGIGSSNPPAATCGGRYRLLMVVARNYLRGKTQGINTCKIDSFRNQILKNEDIYVAFVLSHRYS
jgi:hypothetical protein